MDEPTLAEVYRVVQAISEKLDLLNGTVRQHDKELTALDVKCANFATRTELANVRWALVGGGVLMLLLELSVVILQLLGGQ